MSKKEELSMAQQLKLKAGYLLKPESLRIPRPIARFELHPDLVRHVEVPRDYYKGDMFGGKVYIYDSCGDDLFKEQSRALAIINKWLPEANDLIHGGNLDDDGNYLPQLEGRELEEYQKMVSGDMINTNYGAIMRYSLARELKFKPNDMALTKENELEVKKLLTGNELTIIKPWSIPCGVLGANNDSILLIDEPNILTGQPGRLIAFIRTGVMYKPDTYDIHYDPHTYDIHYDPTD